MKREIRTVKTATRKVIRKTSQVFCNFLNCDFIIFLGDEENGDDECFEMDEYGLGDGFLQNFDQVDAEIEDHRGG